MPEIPDPLVEERAKSAWNRAYYGSRGAPEGVTNWDRQPAKLREARRQAVRDDLGPVWESAYRAGREDETRDALIIRGDLDITTVVAALDRVESEGGDLGRAAGDLLRRMPTWMGSDGHYRPAGPGQVDTPGRCGWRGFAPPDGLPDDGGCVRRAGHSGGHGFSDGSGDQDIPEGRT